MAEKTFKSLLNQKQGKAMQPHQLKIEPGEYQLHFFLEQTRGLQNPELVSESIDPLIKVSVFEDSKTAGPKPRVGNGQTYWGEHMFFSTKIEDSRYFFSHKLRIEVLNYHKIGKNSLVGETSLDLISIYAAESGKHALLHQWAGLSNFQRNYEEIKGFIKFSVTLTGANDDPVVLEKERITYKKNRKFTAHIGGGGSAGADVLLAPQLKFKGHQLRITLIKGDSLMKLDYFGSIDSYVIVEFGNARLSTEPIKNNRNPVYGIVLSLPYFEPSINEVLNLTVMDYDRGKKDDILGTLVIKKSEVLEGRFKEVTWMDIYGSQSENTNIYGNLMNNDSLIGAFWKGRLLMSIEAFALDKPKMAIEKLSDKDLEPWRENPNTNYCVIAEAFYGFSFPKESGDYSIQIRWADKELTLSENKSNKSFCEWYSRKHLDLSLPYYSSKELPDLIIYLRLNGTRVSYLRLPANDFLASEPSKALPSLYYLKPERSVAPDVRSDLAGIVKLRVAVLFEPELRQKVISAWDQSFKKPDTITGTLITNLFHCKDLIPSDNTGTSDPFITVSFMGKECSSEVIEQTLNPVWNQRIYMRVPITMAGPDGTPCYDDSVIVIKIFDRDSIKVLDTQVFSSNEFLGAGVSDVKKLLAEGHILVNRVEPAHPKLIDLEYNGIKVGKILISFNILEYELKIPKEIAPFDPPSERFTVKIRILGLRNLKSQGFFNVQKPYLKFDVNCLKPLGLKDQKSLIVTSKEGGSDPNISGIVRFDADLPIESHLCPSLTCVVFDTVWEGLIQPVLGTFAIDLAKIIEMNPNIRPKAHKIQSYFIGMHPLKMKGEQEDGDVLVEVESEKRQLIVKGKKGRDSEKARKKTKDASTFSPYSETIIKKVRKYPTVVTPEGKVDQDYIVIKPVYVKNAKRQFMTENECPDPEYYLPLGHDKREDKLKNQAKKHYRYYIAEELEKSPFVNQNIFNEYPIFKGKRVVEDDFFELFSLDQKSEEVGLFKGWVDVDRHPEGGKNEDSKVDDLTQRDEDELDAMILRSNDFIARVYVVDALNLQAMDDDSLSDPYLRLVLGSTKIDNRDEYQKDLANVGFYKIFELKCTLPGPSQLKVQVWDHDLLKKDDLIGETVIDLENRYFSKKWRSLAQKPIETRVLYQSTSSLPRGKVRLWVELIPIEKIDKATKWFIEPKPRLEFEIRVVIWDCKNVPSRDKEGTSDIYIVGKLGSQLQKTDTHYRSSDGFGSFNWRMVWRVMLPLSDNTVTFQIWDQDFMTEDDFIAECTVDFGKQAETAYENDAITKIYGRKVIDISHSVESMVEKWVNPKGHKAVKTREIFSVELTRTDKEGLVAKKKPNGKEELKTKLWLSLEIVPLEYALKNPVGNARTEPNMNPWLSPPLKRYNFSIDPGVIISNAFTPEIKAKLIIAAFLGVCLCACCLFMVTFLAGIAANAAV